MNCTGGQGGWWIVASFGGATHHPAWNHNVAAHPDRVSVDTDRHLPVLRLSPKAATS